MTDYNSFLENIWDQLLSREAEKIQPAFSSLDTASQEIVLTHLKRMVSEEGWHSEQVKSAQTALEVLSNRK